MATVTATIRVPRKTRDLLADQASERGLSLSAFLTRVASSGERVSVFEAEREALLTDSRNSEVMAEDHDWAATLDDGLG